MRKAFEKNVALRRPRLRRAATGDELAPGAPEAAPPVALVSRPAAPPPQAATDADVRHERLEKIKRVVAELTAPVPRVELEKIRRRIIRPAPPAGPLPSVPARDADSVLSRVEALGAELARSRQREEALRGELQAAHGDQARTAGEARAATERLAAAYADYLLQVAVRRRAAAEREAKQSAFECALQRVDRERVAASAPLPRQAGNAAFPARAAMPVAVQRRTPSRVPMASREVGSESPSRGQKPEFDLRRLHSEAPDSRGVPVFRTLGPTTRGLQPVTPIPTGAAGVSAFTPAGGAGAPRWRRLSEASAEVAIGPRRAS